MSYRYEDIRPWIFTEEGQLNLLKIRDEANRLCDLAGSVSIEKLTRSCITGDSWKQLALVDRLVEIKEFEYANQKYATQKWILRRIKGEA